MSDFIPSAAQAAAIAEVRDWFENRTEEQQVFRLFGYAGSGKSTVLKFALDDLGLSPHRSAKDGSCVPGVVTATFTGKAALVLGRKGTPARTIHSLIYSVIESTEEEIATAAAKVLEAETAARKLTGFDRTAADAGIETMRQALSAYIVTTGTSGVDSVGGQAGESIAALREYADSMGVKRDG